MKTRSYYSEEHYVRFCVNRIERMRVLGRRAMQNKTQRAIIGADEAFEYMATLQTAIDAQNALINEIKIIGECRVNECARYEAEIAQLQKENAGFTGNGVIL